MTIRVKCGSCAQTLKAEERHAGRSVRCPACREFVTIPAVVPPTASAAEEILDPFAEVAAPPPPVSAAPMPARRPKRTPKPAPPVEPEPAVDDAEIGDWLSEGSPTNAVDDFQAVDSLPPQSPNWDGTAETYDLAELSHETEASPDRLPPKIRKKKRTTVLTGPEEDRKRTARPRLDPDRRVLRGRPKLLWALGACLLPLLFSVVLAEASIADRIAMSVLENPGLDARIEKLPETSEDPISMLLSVFPGHKIHGALLARETMLHWGLAALSGIGFLGLILAVWPDEEVSPGYLIGMGVLTGTVGIMLLLGFQYIADFSHRAHLRTFGVGILGVIRLFLWIFQFIGYSYRCAFDPGIGFGESFFGFTFGVGLCEEFCKAAPIVMYLRSRQRQTWRGATVVGFASGIGFGVSEGIGYSAEKYNGLATPMTYAVRFFSCVALHTIWAGIVGLLMFRDQSHLSELEWEDILLFIVKYLGIAMVLHGLYDALLKFDHDFGALAVAAGSFAWLMWLVRREEAEEVSGALV